MRPSFITLKDVAKAAGVHLSTASRALDQATRRKISPDVVTRVETAALELGYRPNAVAASLRRRRSEAVGLIIPDLMNPVFPPIINGVEETLREAGYALVIASNSGEGARHNDVTDAMLARQVDGLIVASATLDDPVIDDLVRRRIPAVLINRRDLRGRNSSVINDDAGGIEMAVAHLVGLGHRAIAHLAGPEKISTGSLRKQGFFASMRARDLPVDAARVIEAEAFTRAAGRAATARLLACRPRPTAIVAANDLLAIGCYDALREAGLSCPNDVSVTGFNDMPLMDVLAPPLTTARVAHYQMGAEAARLLLRHLEEPTAPQFDVVLRAELIVRGSTAAPKKAASR